jgi:hypothetical protein
MDWLVAGGFTLREEKGRPGALFGDVLLTFERSQLGVRIERDRKQWMIDIAPANGDFLPLHVLHPR